MQRGGPLKRKTPLKRGAPLVSRTQLKRTAFKPKRVSGPPELVEWKAVIRQRSGGICEARLAGVCITQATDAHHVILRSRGGGHEPSNLKHLCRPCHRWAHDNPAAASALGLMASKHG